MSASQPKGEPMQDIENGNTLPPPNTSEKGEKSSGSGGLKSKLAVKPAGESGRRGFHPWHYLKITFRSASRASLLCNVLWPFVPAAIAVRYTMPEHAILIFSLAYIAMVPCANLIGFAGQELARKLPHVIGVLIEITCGSVVEIVLFQVLLKQGLYDVIKAAILGSILATMLLCLGMCFFVGGAKRTEQKFNDAISEVGHGLLFTAGVALAVPTVFSVGLGNYGLTQNQLDFKTLDISRIISVLLIIAYIVYVVFQLRTHHGIYDAIFEHDEEHDEDKHEDLHKAKLTMTECIISLVVAIALVSLIAVTLVFQIEKVVAISPISDPFMGLILVPLVEKFAEHLTAIDEAYDNQMNLALSHVLGATLQTALFNAPLTVIVAWGQAAPGQLISMDLNFEVFNLVMLILSILTVGRFLQDGKSNYLEGFLLVMLYVAIAVAAYHYPDPPTSEGAGSGEGGISHE